MSIAAQVGFRGAFVVAAIALALAPLGQRGRENRSSEGTGTIRASGTALKITSPQAGAAIAGNVVFLSVSVPEGASRAGIAAFADVSPPAPGAAIPVRPGVVLSSVSPIAVGGLGVGTHRLTVVLVDAGGRRVGSASDSVVVAVGGPALRAGAAATSVEGDPWTISVKVDGVRLVAPGGDVSGRTGHLVFLIDLELPPLGATIPLDAENVVHTHQAVVPFTGLEAGEHMVWIVLADGKHRPFSPYVADLVRVTVKVP